ncbi:hypothetical protein TNCT_94121 [Trichonephila clavata]|uniref:Uncharacterized protein n=1 Tax=Trichonephila clavata TaxID=2740835 RepID=A0A8X6L6X4_TRICU|nr:hypothetical protein TNCT_94121 [Trichonephila clavata]
MGGIDNRFASGKTSVILLSIYPLRKRDILFSDGEQGSTQKVQSDYFSIVAPATGENVIWVLDFRSSEFPQSRHLNHFLRKKIVFNSALACERDE